MRQIYTVAVLMVSLVTTGRLAAQTFRESRPLTTSEKRDNLRDVLLLSLRSEVQKRDAMDKLARMSAGEIDDLFTYYTTRRQATAEQVLQQAQRELEQARAHRAHLERLYRQQATARQGSRPVGFAPVVTWLPQGAQLGASAVISPDRRYVRVNAQPFFSSIGNVDTFTFQGQPGLQHPTFSHPIQANRPRFESYYDGLRTRYRVVP